MIIFNDFFLFMFFHSYKCLYLFMYIVNINYHFSIFSSLCILHFSIIYYHHPSTSYPVHITLNSNELSFWGKLINQLVFFQNLIEFFFKRIPFWNIFVIYKCLCVRYKNKVNFECPICKSKQNILSDNTMYQLTKSILSPFH